MSSFVNYLVAINDKLIQYVKTFNICVCHVYSCSEAPIFAEPLLQFL